MSTDDKLRPQRHDVTEAMTRVTTRPQWGRELRSEDADDPPEAEREDCRAPRRRLSPGDEALATLGHMLADDGVHPLAELYARRLENDTLDGCLVVPVGPGFEREVRALLVRAKPRPPCDRCSDGRSLRPGETCRACDRAAADPLVASATDMESLRRAWEEVRRERDEARGELATVLAERDAAVSIGTQLERERDEARRDLQALRDQVATLASTAFQTGEKDADGQIADIATGIARLRRERDDVERLLADLVCGAIGSAVENVAEWKAARAHLAARGKVPHE